MFTQMVDLFVVDEDLEFNEKTQDDSMLLIHEFWLKKRINLTNFNVYKGY